MLVGTALAAIRPRPARRRRLPSVHDTAAVGADRPSEAEDGKPKFDPTGFDDAAQGAVERACGHDASSRASKRRSAATMGLKTSASQGQVMDAGCGSG
jgi:hypothetical protein